MSDTNDSHIDPTVNDSVKEASLGKLDLDHVYDDINQPARQDGVNTNPRALDSQWPQMDITQAGGKDTALAEPHKKPVIVLDPGHSGDDISNVDPKTGLHDHDYPNNPEINQVWDVAQKVGANLEKAGYDVVFTKDSVDSSVSLRDRAEIAKNNHADLAVSIHDDNGKNFDSFAQVYAQEDGGWRGGTAADPTATFNNPEVAAASQSAAANFVAERERAEGRPVDLTQANFADREGIDPGNIPQVQLYAGEGQNAVPWVYNEVGGIGYGADQEAAYVDGLTAAIKKSVPLE